MDRPSVFVESTGGWGEGAVRLMQLPAANEYHDNVVAFWQPQKSPAAGDEWCSNIGCAGLREIE